MIGLILMEHSFTYNFIGTVDTILQSNGVEPQLDRSITRTLTGQKSRDKNLFTKSNHYVIFDIEFSYCAFKIRMHFDRSTMRANFHSRR